MTMLRLEPTVPEQPDLVKKYSLEERGFHKAQWWFNYGDPHAPSRFGNFGRYFQAELKQKEASPPYMHALEMLSTWRHAIARSDNTFNDKEGAYFFDDQSQPLGFLFRSTYGSRTDLEIRMKWRKEGEMGRASLELYPLRSGFLTARQKTQNPWLDQSDTRLEDVDDVCIVYRGNPALTETLELLFQNYLDFLEGD